jgi:hypothetical protein
LPLRCRLGGFPSARGQSAALATAGPTNECSAALPGGAIGAAHRSKRRQRLLALTLIGFALACQHDGRQQQAPERCGAVGGGKSWYESTGGGILVCQAWERSRRVARWSVVRLTRRFVARRALVPASVAAGASPVPHVAARAGAEQPSAAAWTVEGTAARLFQPLPTQGRASTATGASAGATAASKAPSASTHSQASDPKHRSFRDRPFRQEFPEDAAMESPDSLLPASVAQVKAAPFQDRVPNGTAAMKPPVSKPSTTVPSKPDPPGHKWATTGRGQRHAPATGAGPDGTKSRDSTSIRGKVDPAGRVFEAYGVAVAMVLDSKTTLGKADPPGRVFAVNFIAGTMPTDAKSARGKADPPGRVASADAVAGTIPQDSKWARIRGKADPPGRVSSADGTMPPDSKSVRIRGMADPPGRVAAAGGDVPRFQAAVRLDSSSRSPWIGEAKPLSRTTRSESCRPTVAERDDESALQQNEAHQAASTTGRGVLS